MIARNKENATIDIGEPAGGADLISPYAAVGLAPQLMATQ